MMTLTEFLLARIAEDEEAAQGATIEPVGSGRTWFDGWSDAHPVGRHIGRWAPARVLAECEAKRLIVNLHWPGHDEEPDPEGGCVECGEIRGHCLTRLYLAIPYADHPQFQPEWRP
jgi:hypothetical protein